MKNLMILSCHTKYFVYTKKEMDDIIANIKNAGGEIKGVYAQNFSGKRILGGKWEI